MRVTIFGGTGYVGSHLVDALVAAGHRPVLLVRPGSEHKVEQADACDTVSGDVFDPQAVARAVEGADAVIFNIGILREDPESGVTFERMQFDAARHAIDGAVQAGARRFLLMSANGARADGTDYQRSKFQAEEYLRATDLDWTVFRPSVLFGDPRGRMEFATQLKRDIIDAPMPAPLFYPGLLPTGAGQFAMSPVHVDDVARAFVTALERPDTFGQTYRLGGPAEVSWRAILQTIADAVGKKKLMLPAPAWGVSLVAGLLERFPAFPITRDQITMLLEGNTCPPDDLVKLGIEPQPFDAASLAYLNR
jgi:NADH dehydrogenase